MLRTCGLQLRRALSSTIRPSSMSSSLSPTHTRIVGGSGRSNSTTTATTSTTQMPHTTATFPSASSPLSATQAATSHHPKYEPLATPAASSDQPDIRTHHERPRKPQPPPLLRNFFAGHVDTDLLTYPEPINREDMQLLNASVQRTSDWLAARTSSTTDDDDEGLRALGAFGLDVPAAWGGSNAVVTELTRHAEVEAGADVYLAARLNAHRLAVRCLVECGSSEQKDRYLPLMASGQLMGAVAFYEAVDDGSKVGGNIGNGSAAAAGGCVFRTRATLAPDDSADWLLHGAKSCVTNAAGADVLIVFAQTLAADRCGDPQESVSAFVVDRRQQNAQDGSYEIGAADQTLGMRAASQSAVRLRGARAQLLGELGDGAAVAQRMLRTARLQTATVALAMQKKLLQRWTRYAIASDAVRTSVAADAGGDAGGVSGGGAAVTATTAVQCEQAEQLRARLSRAHCAAYALESMLYMTTSLLDEYVDADVDVETAAMRVFAVESLRKVALMGLEFAGAQAVLEGGGGVALEELRDALQLCGQGESNDALRTFVGLSGAKKAGETLHDVVRKVRNPLYNPSFMFRRLFETANIENPKCTQQLNHYLHPTLDPAAQFLEQSVLRLQAATEVTLTRHGVQIIDRQCELRRLASMAIRCYAAFASVARASRSYCIGLQAADYEMQTAGTFAFDAHQEVLRLALEVRDGPYLTNDVNHQKIAGHVLRSGGYMAAHPLQRNF